MKYILAILLLSSCSLAVTIGIDRIFSRNSKLIKIAVIDTGIDLENISVNICKNGLIDLTGTSIQDNYGHGQNIAHIIGSHLQGVNYCMYIIKFTDGQLINRDESVRAFKKAKDLKVDIINFSAGGKGIIDAEEAIIKDLEKMNVPIIAAAGNDNLDLRTKCEYFPACYTERNVFIVGSLNDKDEKSSFSNYGPGIVNFWWSGENQEYGGKRFSGTSQATGHITGLIVKGMKP